MAGLLFARAGVPRAGAREARRLLPRFPRRHRPPLDDGDPRPARACSSASSKRPHDRLDTGADPRRRARLYDRRPVAPRHAGAVHRDDAAVGFPRFPARRGGGFPGFRAARWKRRSTGFIEEGGRIAGVRLADGRELRAGKLVIAADGRASLVRRLGLLPLEDARRADGRVLVPRCPRPSDAGDALRGIGRDRADGRADRPRRLIGSAPS